MNKVIQFKKNKSAHDEFLKIAEDLFIISVSYSQEGFSGVFVHLESKEIYYANTCLEESKKHIDLRDEYCYETVMDTGFKWESFICIGSANDNLLNIIDDIDHIRGEEDE